MKVMPKETKTVTSFEDLNVFQLAYKISLNIHKVSLEFPKIEQYALADQIRRSSKSICANIAEGYGKQAYSLAEFKRFIAIAIGSSDEMRVWIRYCLDLGYVTSNQSLDWIEEYKKISKMLQTLYNNWK